MQRKGVVAVVVGFGLMGAQALGAHGQDRRGRKYKEPPPVSHVEVVVTKGGSDKPISNAAVIFRATRDGKDDGNLELKTDPDGKASIDVIQTGSSVQVQVIAKGYATYADVVQVDSPSKSIHVELERPREQVSAYQDNSGKASSRKWGVQEPVKQTPQPPAQDGTLQKRTDPPPAASGSSNPEAQDATPPAKSDGDAPPPPKS